MQHSKQKYSQACSQISAMHPHCGQAQTKQIIWGAGRERRQDGICYLPSYLTEWDPDLSAGSSKLYRSLGQGSTKQRSSLPILWSKEYSPHSRFTVWREEIADAAVGTQAVVKACLQLTTALSSVWLWGKQGALGSLQARCRVLHLNRYVNREERPSQDTSWVTANAKPLQSSYPLGTHAAIYILQKESVLSCATITKPIRDNGTSYRLEEGKAIHISNKEISSRGFSLPSAISIITGQWNLYSTHTLTQNGAITTVINLTRGL